MTGYRKALVAVLELNFERLGSAAEMIRHGDFAIQDEGTGADVDLSQPWEDCFFPGKRVSMSMIFSLPQKPDTSCPRCKTVSGESCDQDVEWYVSDYSKFNTNALDLA